MSTQLEDLIRSTLTDHAPTTVPSADWATLRSRATRRTVTGRATVVAGAAAVGALAITAPWDSPTVAGGPSAVIPTTAVPEPTAVPTASPTAEETSASLAPSVVDAALTFSRSPNSDWSRGSATFESIELALETLMASDQVTDPSAQPQVLWARAGHDEDDAQGPQVVVAVEQADRWVLGYRNERQDLAQDEPMTFGTMPGGPLTDRLVGFVIQGEDLGLPTARHIIYVAPVGATRVVQVLDAAMAEYSGVPVGTELELEAGFGDYAFSSPQAIRAYAADGTLLDEWSYD